MNSNKKQFHTQEKQQLELSTENWNQTLEILHAGFSPQLKVRYVYINTQTHTQIYVFRWQRGRLSRIREQ